MDREEEKKRVKVAIEEFLQEYEKYVKNVRQGADETIIGQSRTNLQRKAPLITSYVLDIKGEGSYGLGLGGTMQISSLLGSAVMGGNNEVSHNLAAYETVVLSMLNSTLGTIEADLWPPTEHTPILEINDAELKSRCADLLSASGNYDRVIREATIVLETRLRNKCPHEKLSSLIPNSINQSGTNLVNILLSPSDPVLIYSSEQKERAGFHQIILGVVMHLRNPSHHDIDENTKWSWSWSIVGLIDRLLMDIDSCQIREET